jgi:hypothetical protein
MQKKEQQKPTPKKKDDEKEVIVFERPTPYGWYTVVFPNKHDLEGEFHLATWWNDAHEWMRLEGIKVFSTYVRGVDKKHRDVSSPVFFFKDRMDAMRVSWRWSGEVIQS